MKAAQKIVTDLNQVLIQRKFDNPETRKAIIAFVIQQKSLTGKEVFNLLKKKDINKYYDHMESLHSAFYCITNDLIKKDLNIE